MDIFEWLREMGYALTDHVMAAAVCVGDLRMIRFLQKNECPWNTYCLASAAYNGHLGHLAVIG
jgi:hypothetical protein